MAKGKTYVCTMRYDGDCGEMYQERNVSFWGKLEWDKFNSFMDTMCKRSGLHREVRSDRPHR